MRGYLARMVRRPLRLRLCSALLALSLGPALVGPPSLHGCPMHGGLGGAMAGMAGMPDHAGGQHDRPAGSRKGSHPCCNCIGMCAGAGPMPASPAGQVVSLARENVRRPAFAAVVAPRQSAHLNLLPFGTAPPIS